MTGPSRVPFSLYLITDDEVASLAARVDAALLAVPRGSVAVQLRAKSLDGRSLLAAALALRAVTTARAALLFLNDRVDIALAAGCDGVHLPARGLPIDVARRLAPSLLLGVSTHSPEEAARAVEEGADFVTLGPIFSTPSKRGMGEPLGLAPLAAAVAACARVTPGAAVFALGGVDRETAPGCVAAGARLACIRAVLDARSPSSAALALVTLARATP